MLRRVRLVKSREECQFALLLFRAYTTWRIQIWKGFGCRAEADPLVNGRHESLAPVARAAINLAIVVAQHSEGREILIFGAQTVTNPGAQRRPAAQNRAGVHLSKPVRVIQPLAPARAN